MAVWYGYVDWMGSVNYVSGSGQNSFDRTFSTPWTYGTVHGCEPIKTSLVHLGCLAMRHSACLQAGVAATASYLSMSRSFRRSRKLWAEMLFWSSQQLSFPSVHRLLMIP